jgi:hypothetical protein
MVIKSEENTALGSLSSAGHKLGQIVGDWWETQVIFPLLGEVALELGLFLDNRIVERDCRQGKIQWSDSEGNYVDYDYVLEIGGTKVSKGIPVAFIESFWRRGARHSKDKARDDTNKLLPMRENYPTARFLAIAACGEFTEPAREYVRSRNVELFFISKEKIINAFQSNGLEIDYPDSYPEDKKNRLVRDLESRFTPSVQSAIAKSLRSVAGAGAFNAFKQRIIGSLTAMPQEIKIYMLKKSAPVIFNNIVDAQNFLKTQNPSFPLSSGIEEFEYEVVFSDGTEFGRSLSSLDKVRQVNEDLTSLVKHIQSLMELK